MQQWCIRLTNMTEQQFINAFCTKNRNRSFSFLDHLVSNHNSHLHGSGMIVRLIGYPDKYLPYVMSVWLVSCDSISLLITRKMSFSSSTNIILKHCWGVLNSILYILLGISPRILSVGLIWLMSWSISRLFVIFRIRRLFIFLSVCRLKCPSLVIR